MKGNKMLTRRQFFARLRGLGFSKSRIQMTRIGLSYEKEAEHGRVTVSVPKHHESTFHILGDVPYSGIFVEKTDGRAVNWGTPVDTNALGLTMLEVCLGLCSGGIELVRQPTEGGAEGGPA
jgi:hypothetical protein